MKLINDYDDYRAKINLLKKTAIEADKRLMSNCYFLPAKIKELIVNKELFIEEQNGNIYIFEDGKDFYRLYYFIWNTDNIMPLNLPLPAVIEYTYKNNISDKQAEEIELIKSLGFTLGRQSGRMILKASSIAEFENNIDSDIKLEYAKNSDKPKIQELLHSAFIPLYAFLPDENELNQLINNNSILALRYKGSLAGIWKLLEKMHGDASLLLMKNTAARDMDVCL